MENFDCQNWFPRWCVSPAKSQPPYVYDDTDHFITPLNNGVVFAEYTLDDFANGEDNSDPLVVPTAQDSYPRQGTSSAEGHEIRDNIQSHSLPTDTVGSEFNTSHSEYENTLALHDYDLLDSSVSSTASASIDSFDFCDQINANFPILLSNTSSPTFGNYPHNYGSPSTFESTDTSPATALGTADSSSEPISTYPTYDDHPESPYNDVGNTTPSNTSLPYDTSSRTLNDGYWSEALSDFFSLFEGEPTVNGTSQEKALESRAGQNVSTVTTVPAENGVDNYDFCDEFNTNFLISLSDINPPTFGNYPHDYNSPSTLESTDTSPAVALGTSDSNSKPVSTYPTYEDYLENPYDDVDNATPSNTSLPYDTSSQSTLKDGHWSEALSDFFALIEGEPTVDGTSQEKDLDFRAGQDVSNVTIVPAENKNTDEFNPQRTWNEQSTWGVNSFFKEGIIPLTNTCDHDTEAGPSTGSSVAAAMLDIEQAKHGQRDDWAASISAAPEEQKGKGKRKAIDAPEPPEPPPPSKKLRIDPSAQTMGNIIFTQPAPDFTVSLEGFNQSDIWKFVHVSGGERQPPLSSEEPTYMTLKHNDNGELEARDMVSARDSHARRLQKEN